MKKILSLILFITVLGNIELPAQPYYAWYKRTVPTLNNLNFTAGVSGGVLILGNSGVILYKSSNTSLWVQQSSGTTSNLNFYIASGTNHLVCGNSGVLLKSTNVGTNWVQVNSGTTANLKCLQRLNTSNYAAFGDNGVYIQTTDAGANWAVKPNFTNQNLTCAFTSGISNFVCGAGGAIFRSTDFGVSWVNVSLTTSVNLSSITFSDGNNGIVTGENGFIASTTNGGANWTSQISTVNTKLNSIALGTNYSYIVGNNGVILRAANPGNNWSQQSPLTTKNLNFTFFTGEAGFVVGDSGTVFERRTDTTFFYSTNINYNNFSGYFTDRLVINKDIRYNAIGLEWPRGSGKFLSDAMGMSITAKVNGVLRTAAAFQKGEFTPGYSNNGQHFFDNRFKIYKVKKTDSPTSYSWQRWGDMVPFGAPYVDVNMNGMYEPLIDTPGVKSAGETNFICVSDAADTAHHVSNGYGAGTLPLGAEIHFTIWADHFMIDTANTHFTDDAIFMKYEIINKSGLPWTGTYFSFLNDGFIGDETDDYIGCDTTKELAYYYNSDNTDNNYGTSPPSWGIALLKGAYLPAAPNVDLGMTSMGYFYGTTGCTSDNMTSDELYNMAKGFKKDGTPWVNIQNNQPTKFNYTGDVETAAGWTEFNGRILNCGGSLSGSTEIPSTPRQRNIIFSTGSENLTMNPGDKQVLVLVQAVGRGSNNKNGVTKLKQYIENIKQLYYIPRFSVNIHIVNSAIPDKFLLHQNYPNPFNPDNQNQI
jgi:photosystem II stability/assembly factor-like uncharacterized protein